MNITRYKDVEIEETKQIFGRSCIPDAPVKNIVYHAYSKGKCIGTFNKQSEAEKVSKVIEKEITNSNEITDYFDKVKQVRLNARSKWMEQVKEELMKAYGINDMEFTKIWQYCENQEYEEYDEIVEYFIEVTNLIVSLRNS